MKPEPDVTWNIWCAEVAFWLTTGERQSSRIRVAYLRAILRQDVAFFDKETGTGEVISRLSGDTLLIQSAIGEQVGPWPASLNFQEFEHCACLQQIVTVGSLAARQALDMLEFHVTCRSELVVYTYLRGHLQVGKFIQFMGTFVVGYIIAFTKGWKLSLVVVSSLPLLFAAGAMGMKVIQIKNKRSLDAYAEAAKVVEQALGSIRTVPDNFLKVYI